MSFKLAFSYPIVGLYLIGIVGCAPPQSNTTAAKSSNHSVTVIEPTKSLDTTSEYALNRDELGRALRGYDPVAYFQTGQATPGKEAYRLIWQDAIWSFSSLENRDAFAQEPERYAPANGGYCTFGIVLSKKFDGDPEVWLIHDGRLYVFLNVDVQEAFLQDEPGNFSRVSTNWPLIKDKSPKSLQSS